MFVTLLVLTSYINNSSKGNAYCLCVGAGWYCAHARNLVSCPSINNNIVYGRWGLRFLPLARAVKDKSKEVKMLLTKYKVQDVIEDVHLDINDIMKGLQKHDEVQEWDNSHAFVAGYVEQLVKDAIIDQLGRM